jgi:hypothetical protein
MPSVVNLVLIGALSRNQAIILVPFITDLLLKLPLTPVLEIYVNAVLTAIT